MVSIYKIKMIGGLLILACLTSCYKISSTPWPRERWFLTGECLEGLEMRYDPYNQMHLYGVDSCMINLDRIVFSFSLNMKYHIENTSVSWNGIVGEFRCVPPLSVFKELGGRAGAVKQEFESIYEAVTSDARPLFYVSTVFYDGGLELTADKGFAGIPAGQNLLPLLRQRGITSSPDDYTTQLFAEYGSLPIRQQFPLTESFREKCIVPPVFGLNVPVKGFRVVHERIVFNLTIPVKSVNYLHWLSDRMDDPAAEMPYEEKVLSCTFSSNVILR